MKKSVCFSALLNASISLITLQAMEAPKHVFIYVLILLLALGRLEGQEAERCDPRFCRLPDCYCGGSTIPGGYEPKDIPQFVLLTFDDAVNGLNQKFFDALFKNRNNPNGCPIKVFKMLIRFTIRTPATCLCSFIGNILRFSRVDRL